MVKNDLDDFEGFILEDGQMIPVEDSDRVLAAIRERRSAPNREIYGKLCKLYAWCLEAGLDGTATIHAYIDAMVLYAELPEQKAHCLLALGQLKEREGAFAEALEAYRSAFDLRPKRRDAWVWYFLNNNLGFCLNYFGKHTEAEQYCRAAIEINPARYNAFKNLGIALWGQGRYKEAAEAFIRSTHMLPRDQRALNLLEDLLDEQKDNLPDIANLMVRLKECRKLAEEAAVH